jgi:hypothetical protein
MGSLDVAMQRLNFVLPLPHPHEIAPLTQPLGDREQEVVRRFRRQVGDLVESMVFQHASSYTLTITRNEADELQESVVESFPPRENLRGLAAAFRQVYSDGEPASFHACQGIFAQAVRAQRDPFTEERMAYVSGYGRIHGLLKNKSTKTLYMNKIYEMKLGGWPSDDGVNLTPELLISIYNYGDLIHWDKRATELATMEWSDANAAVMRMEWLEAMDGFIALYIAYAEMLRTALGWQMPTY